METWIEVAGLTIRSPVTAFTNLLLSVQCCVYWRRLRSRRADRAGYWWLFFLAMAVATLAGVPKHGLRHVLPADVYLFVLWTSSLGSAASVYCAQRATLASAALNAGDGRLVRLCALQACVFLGANVALGPEMWLIVVHTAVGLIPVIGAEALAARRGSRRAMWIAGGLGVSLLTGVVYVGRLSLGAWFNHIDVAHALMGVSFWLIVKGAPAAGSHGRTRPAEVRARAKASLGSLVGLQEQA